MASNNQWGEEELISKQKEKGGGCRPNSFLIEKGKEVQFCERSTGTRKGKSWSEFKA